MFWRKKDCTGFPLAFWLSFWTGNRDPRGKKRSLSKAFGAAIRFLLGRDKLPPTQQLRTPLMSSQLHGCRGLRGPTAHGCAGPGQCALRMSRAEIEVSARRALVWSLWEKSLPRAFSLAELRFLWSSGGGPCFPLAGSQGYSPFYSQAWAGVLNSSHALNLGYPLLQWAEKHPALMDLRHYVRPTWIFSLI